MNWNYTILILPKELPNKILKQKKTLDFTFFFKFFFKIIKLFYFKKAENLASLEILKKENQKMEILISELNMQVSFLKLENDNLIEQALEENVKEVIQQIYFFNLIVSF